MIKREKVVIDVIAKAGSVRALARALGISYEAVWKWRRVPPARVLEVEALTGIPRESLRPDIYGAPRPRPRKRRGALEVVA